MTNLRQLQIAVARELGKVCIVGCEGLSIDPSGRKGLFGTETIEEGEILSVDGAGGEIYRDAIEVLRERPDDLLAKIAQWRATAGSGAEPAVAKLRTRG